MTQCLSMKILGRDIERVSDYIWEQWSGVEGLQEGPGDGANLFAMREDFEILEFGSEAAKKAAHWLESNAYRGNGMLTLKVYLSEEIGKSEVQNYLKKLGQDLGVSVEEWGFETLDTVDYLAEYRKNVRGTALGKNLWVGPPWDDSEERKKRISFVVDPGLAFGTGDHPTTQLMLLRIEELASHKPRFERILDLGCGTGVLGLAARYFLKPNRLVLSDLDPLCEAEVKKTFDLNAQPLFDSKTEVFFGQAGTAENLASKGVKFDLIISNIYAEVLALIAPAIEKLLAPGGVWLCSGILAGKSEEVLEKATHQNFDCRERRTLLKKGAVFNTQVGMQNADETWVLCEYQVKS